MQGPSLGEIFKPEGLLARRLPRWEFRQSQFEMAAAVRQCIESRDHLCVEAGTGTGKTLSYLIPALASGRRVLVSTATKNLQDQILSKDIPFLREFLFPRLRTACMKGRHNFLCRRRYREMKRQQAIGESGLAEALEGLRGWLRQTEAGDRAELEWLGDEDPLWESIDARSDACTGQRCSDFEDCFVTRMRQRAFEADLVVVNHALFFSNLALESDEVGRLLPDFSVVILDEAHEVEDIAAQHFGEKITNYQIDELVRDVRRTLSGRHGEILRTTDRIERGAMRFFSSFPGDEGRHSLNFFRTPDGRATADLRDNLGAEWTALASGLATLYHQLEQIRSDLEESEPLIRRVSRHSTVLQDLFEFNDSDHVFWFEKRGRGVQVNLTPIDVSGLLREKLFDRADTIVLTSATLRTQGDFRYIRERLGFEDAVELAVPGEFDYASQAALYVPRDMPEPSSADYFSCLIDEIRSVLRLTNGRAFLLFTSLRQMRRVYAFLKENECYPLLCQGEQPKARLLELFRNTPGAVLCATSSFWQGVDVPGDDLKAVIIDKLPFQVPSEPLVAARMHRLAEGGGNPFWDYSVPSAIITLRQGLGRLIRSKSDTGLLAVMDSRLWFRRYGRLFFKSLPKCPVADKIGVLENFFLQIESKDLEGDRFCYREPH